MMFGTLIDRDQWARMFPDEGLDQLYEESAKTADEEAKESK